MFSVSGGVRLEVSSFSFGGFSLVWFFCDRVMLRVYRRHQCMLFLQPSASCTGLP